MGGKAFPNRPWPGVICVHTRLTSSLMRVYRINWPFHVNIKREGANTGSYNYSHASVVSGGVGKRLRDNLREPAAGNYAAAAAASFSLLLACSRWRRRRRRLPPPPPPARAQPPLSRDPANEHKTCQQPWEAAGVGAQNARAREPALGPCVDALSRIPRLLLQDLSQPPPLPASLSHARSARQR